MADVVLISPRIIEFETIDQTQAKSFEFMVSRNDGASYFMPTKITIRWSSKIYDADGNRTIKNGELPFTNLSQSSSPKWTRITIPANTFPTGPRFGQVVSSFIATCEYTVPGGFGIMSYFSPDFFNFTPAEIHQRSYADGDYIDDRSPNEFVWDIMYNRNCVTMGTGWVEDASPYKQSSATFQWRNGTSGTIQTINISGKTQSVTVAANTFPLSTSALQWRVRAVMSDGTNTDYSGWQTLTTTESVSSARVVSPRAAYLTGNDANTFVWEHVTASGTTQTKAELQYSTDAGGSWKALRTVTGSAKSVVVPAGTLPGGNLLWKVRTYNADNIAGSWSEAAGIVVYAAPNRPGLMPVDPVPRPLLRWQSAEQQSFEVLVDGWSSGPVFGTAKEYRIPFWLADGSHSLAVRVQSSLGLWSDWSEVKITVANTSPGDIRLTSRAIDNGARLTWAGTCQRYIIYRDDSAIGETAATQWIDWLAAGKHRYQVRGISGEYYAMSNEIIEFSRCRWGVISAVDFIDWIPLQVRQGSQPGHGAESSCPVTLRYFDGRVLPVAEVSPFADKTHTFDYTLRRDERGLLPRLRALLGKMVIYKNRAGTRVFGILTSLSEQDNGHAIELSFAITETDWREYDEA